MPILHEMSTHAIQQALAESQDRSTPISLTCRTEQTWLQGSSHLLQRVNSSLWLAWPEPLSGDALTVGQPVALSFKLRHHKHICNTEIHAIGQFRVESGNEVRALRVGLPSQMLRVQRRAYQRVEVPRSESALATFWAGSTSQLEDAQPPAVTWEGWVTNLSAGGFQVRLAGKAAPQLEEGDVVAVRIDLGQQRGPIVADAQFRHAVPDHPEVLLQGFQFVGLSATPAGRQTLRSIGQVVYEFQRLAARSSAQRAG